MENNFPFKFFWLSINISPLKQQKNPVRNPKWWLNYVINYIVQPSCGSERLGRRGEIQRAQSSRMWALYSPWIASSRRSDSTAMSSLLHKTYDTCNTPGDPWMKEHFESSCKIESIMKVCSSVRMFILFSNSSILWFVNFLLSLCKVPVQGK